MCKNAERNESRPAHNPAHAGAAGEKDWKIKKFQTRRGTFITQPPTHGPTRAAVTSSLSTPRPFLYFLDELRRATHHPSAQGVLRGRRRAKELEGKKTSARAAAAAAPRQPFKTALVINGGGLLPVASAYGIFRGLYKANVGDVPCALDQFDVMAGASLLPRLGLTAHI